MSEVQVEIPVAEIEVSTELKNIIEALIFASDEPMSVRFIRSIVDEANKELQPSGQITINAEIIRKAVAELNKAYIKVGSAFRIIEIAGGFVHATQEQFATWVGKLAKEKARRRLSPTAIETLAIIAYKQPITKTEVEFIRGVNADYIINALLEKDLILITGRQSSPGRPLLYGTTQKFLEHFGLNELTDLPKPREIAELINETEAEVDRRLLAEQQELEFREDLEQKLEGHEGAAKISKVGDTGSEKGRKKKTEVVAKDSNGGEGSAQKSEVGGQLLEVSNQAPEMRDQKSEKSDVTLQMNVDEKEETKSGEVSTPDVIDEIAVEGTDETPVESETRVDMAAETGEEVAVHFQSDEISVTKEIPIAGVSTEMPHKIFDEGGAELSAQSGEITEEQNLQAIGGGDAVGTQTEQGAGRENGWSKWKTKVKTFFKKLFG